MAFTPTPPTDEDLENRFNHHPPTSGMIETKFSTLRACLENTAKAVVRITPPGREQATAITKLEEAMFWANAAVARNQEFYGPAEFPEGPAQGIV